MSKECKRLSVEFPAEEYIYLKMACAREGVSLKDFVVTALTMYIADYENKLALTALEKELTDDNLKNAVSLDQLKSELGINEKEV
jgi:hypothetical protein